MKIRVNCNELLKKLAVIEKGLPTRTSFPAIEGIYIEKKGDNVILCSNNLEMAVKTFFPVNEIGNEDEGATVLPKQFTQIVKQLPDSEVEITVEDNRAEIVSGKSKFKLNCLDAEDYPLFDESYMDNPFIELEGSSLKDLIKKTTFCVSNNAGNPLFSGVLMINNPDEDEFVCVASDTYRLAWYEKLKVNTDEHFRVLVPGKLLAEVGKIIKDDDAVRVYITEKELVFVVNEYVISVRLLEGKYPDLAHVFPKEVETKTKVNGHDFIDTLNRAELVAEGHNRLCSLSITDVLKVEAGSEIGKMNEELPVEVEGEPLEQILINAKYVLDGVKAFDENVSIEFNGMFGPVVMKEEGFKYLVLPIKKN